VWGKNVLFDTAVYYVHMIFGLDWLYRIYQHLMNMIIFNPDRRWNYTQRCNMVTVVAQDLNISIWYLFWGFLSLPLIEDILLLLVGKIIAMRLYWYFTSSATNLIVMYLWMNEYAYCACAHICMDDNILCLEMYVCINICWNLSLLFLYSAARIHTKFGSLICQFYNFYLKHVMTAYSLEFDILVYNLWYISFTFIQRKLQTWEKKPSSYKLS
jgi:hypothetical protein